MNKSKVNLFNLFVILFILAFQSTSTAHAGLISDGDFVDWIPFHFNTDDPYWLGSHPNVSTGTGQRIATGGNLGAYLQLAHTFTTGDTSWVGAIKTDVTYDPLIEGAINSLSFTADVNTSIAAWQLVVEQSGQRYFSFPFGVASGSIWQSITASNLTEADFDTNPWAGNALPPDGNHPDFGSIAAPLQFGFMFGNRVTGGTATNTSGLDNFSLSLVSTPPTTATEPETYLLIGVGLMGILVARKNTSCVLQNLA